MRGFQGVDKSFESVITCVTQCGQYCSAQLMVEVHRGELVANSQGLRSMRGFLAVTCGQLRMLDTLGVLTTVLWPVNLQGPELHERERPPAC